MSDVYGAPAKMRPTPVYVVGEGASSSEGGLSSTHRLLSSAASTNLTSVKATPGRIYGVEGYNKSASIRYVKLYNKASAPVIATDTPIRTIEVAGSSHFSVNFGDIGRYCSLGIAYAMTTGQADISDTAVSAGDITSFHIDYA